MFSQWQDLILNLIRKEFKARYFGTFLGFFWALGNPLITFGLYYFVFTFILPNPMPNYALYLVTGTLHWAIFTQILTQGTGYLLDNASFIQKISFPRIILPIAGVGTNLVFWLAALGIYFMFYSLLGGAFAWVTLIYPLLLMLFIMFAWGIALILSVANVAFRDVRYLLEVLLPLGFWLTPIVWRFEQVPPHITPWLKLNPIVFYFDAFQKVLVWQTLPSASLLGLLLVISCGTLCVGLYVFNTFARRVTAWL
jgi:lipopolysaccharide transport system permease protein